MTCSKWHSWRARASIQRSRPGSFAAYTLKYQLRPPRLGIANTQKAPRAGSPPGRRSCCKLNPRSVAPTFPFHSHPPYSRLKACSWETRISAS